MMEKTEREREHKERDMKEENTQQPNKQNKRLIYVFLFASVCVLPSAWLGTRSKCDREDRNMKEESTHQPNIYKVLYYSYFYRSCHFPCDD
jgi:hypothetical protein